MYFQIFTEDSCNKDVESSEDFQWLQKKASELNTTYIKKWVETGKSERSTFFQNNPPHIIFDKIPNLASKNGFKLVSNSQSSGAVVCN